MDPVTYRLRVFLVVLFAVLVLGTLGFMITEDLSAVDAFYFTIVTIATVGYGDIHPDTQTGQILALAMIITGVGHLPRCDSERNRDNAQPEGKRAQGTKIKHGDRALFQ